MMAIGELNWDKVKNFIKCVGFFQPRFPKVGGSEAGSHWFMGGFAYTCDTDVTYVRCVCILPLHEDTVTPSHYDIGTIGR